MNSTDGKKSYFDLHIQGVGYFSRIREVETKSGSTFLSATIAALWGPVDDANYTYFDVRVSGRQLNKVVTSLRPAVEEGKKVLMGFTLSDLHVSPYSLKDGRTGVNTRSRLIRITWCRVEGQPFHLPDLDVADAA